MDTKDLELFLALSENLHFSQTGDALHMSASAVSRGLKKIEQEVGQRLLERDNRSVRMTETGRQFQSVDDHVQANQRTRAQSTR